MVCVLSVQPSFCSCMVGGQCQRVLEPTARCHRVGEKNKKQTSANKCQGDLLQSTARRVEQSTATAGGFGFKVSLYDCRAHVFYELMFIPLTHQSLLFILIWLGIKTIIIRVSHREGGLTMFS